MLLCLYPAAYAEQRDGWSEFTDVPFRHYGKDAGLPSPVIESMVEDGDGFLWVGTQGGLGRWDGYRFRTYKPAADPHALADGWINDLHTDPRGRLWIGTSAGGLARYDREQDQFVNYRVGPKGSGSDGVNAIADAGGGALWVGTNDGLYHLDPDTGQIVSYHHASGDPASLPEGKIGALMVDRDGVLWIGSAHHGLSRRNPGSDRFEAVPLGPQSSPSLTIWSLFQDKGGRIWIGAKPGAFVLQPGDSLPRPVVESGSTTISLKAESIRTISAGTAGEVWLGTLGHGVFAVDVASGRTRRITHEPERSTSLANDTVWAIYKDRSGGVWVASTGDLGRLEDNSESILTVSGKQRYDALAENDVLAILSAADKKVWVGMNTKGIDIFDLDLNRVAHISTHHDRANGGLPESYIMSLVQSPNGDVYIATQDGIYRADSHGDHIVRITLPGRDPTACTYDMATVGAKLWIGGCDDGLWAFTPTSTASHVEHFGADRLTDPRIVSLAAGANDDLWIGTRNGLNRLDLSSVKVEKILPDLPNQTALQSPYITSLMLDRDKRLWLSTQGGGIQVLVGRPVGRPVFQRIGGPTELPNDNVSSLLADATGRIWAYTEGGVAIVDPVNFGTHILSPADGVPSSIPWDHSAAALPSGELLFGTTGVSGMTVIRPDRFHVWNYRPPIVVTEARVSGKVIPASRFNSAAAGNTLIVRPESNGLEVRFAALDYSDPENNRYAYRLEGFDKDWVDTDSSRRSAVYTNLPPGHYVLHLRGSNRNGVWSDRTLNLPIRVLPAWFQTLWFRLILALSALLCVFALVHGRTVYLRKRQKELERVVASRTAELEKSKRENELLASHDPLTGLPNRRQFNTDIARLTALVERNGHNLALLLIDLDRFKQINDTLGHDAGDALLVEAAHRMQLAVRTPDCVCRLGGDEFAILISDLPGPNPGVQMQEGIDPDVHRRVEVVCARIVNSFVNPIEFNGAQMKTSASIGVALYREHASTPEALYKASDLALYEAKRGGKNTWRWNQKSELAHAGQLAESALQKSEGPYSNPFDSSAP